MSSAMPSEFLIGALLQAARTLEARREQALAGAELTSARYGVLEQLVHAGGTLSLGELAARLDCVRSNMTQLVDRLEAEGLVRRVGDPRDRRSVRAELTPLGVERQRAGAERLRQVHARFHEAVRDHDRAVLQRALAALE